MLKTHSSTEEEWNITVEIYNKLLRFKLDTGAKCNVLPIEKLDSSIQLKPTTTRLVSYSGNLVEPEGTVVLPVSYRDKQYSLQFYFVNKPVQAILGLKACEQLNVIQRVEEINKTLKSERDIFVAYKDVFSTNSIGCLLTTYYIEIDKNVRPVIHAPRQVPAALRPKQPTLRYYYVMKPVKISCDSSKCGLGDVLEQDAWSSRSIRIACVDGGQQRYAQIEKELLAIVFACDKFNQFIYGKTVS